MRKGKFGFVLCAYPIAAFCAVILRSPGIASVLFALAVFLEKDEWTSRQTMQAWLLSLIVLFFNNVLTWAVTILSALLHFSPLTVAASVLSVLVYLAAMIGSIIGILRVMKEQEANLVPFAELAERFFGKMRKPVFYQQPYQGTPQNGQPPYPQQPYAAPPQNAEPQRPEEPKQ